MATIEMITRDRTRPGARAAATSAILKAFKEAMVELGLEPHQFTVVSGIGQAGKFPHYTQCNTFNGLHGRALPVATGSGWRTTTCRSSSLPGTATATARAGTTSCTPCAGTSNVKLFVHDNQIYGLTKGQASPTSTEGTVSKIQPFGVISGQLNPMALAVALDCSFVARGFAGDTEHLKDLMKEAMNHRVLAR